MKAQRHPTSRPRAGAMAQTRQPSGSSTPPQPPPHLRTRLAHDPRRRRHGGVDVLRARVPPLRLQAGEARGTHHNVPRVTWDLCEMTATRSPPPRQICTARRLAQSPLTTTTRHIETGVFQRRTKKEKRRAPKLHIADKDQSPQTRATCDVRTESRRVHWARRGRDYR